MSERKLDQIETMFKKTAQPKLEIDEIRPIKKLGVIIDDTPQGKLAIELATSLAKKIEGPLDVIITEEYFEAFDMLIEGTRNELDKLKAIADEQIEEKDIYAKTDVVVASRVQKVLELFEEEIGEEDKLGARLVTKLEEMDNDIVVVGVPLFHGREESEAENLGGYVTKLLRARRIHSNFLLVSDTVTPELKDSILAFVSIEQQPGSIVALTKRALTLASDDTEIQLVGMIDDKIIETVARVDQLDEDITEEDGENNLDLEGAEERLEQKMEETLSSIKINEDIPHGSFKGEVSSGSIASMVNTALDEIQPGIVLVRSVAEIEENLDPIAEQITRIILRSGYPCLVVWD